MDKQELIDKIRRGTDIEIRIGEMGFTIFDGDEYPQKEIAVWGKDELNRFQSAEELVNSFQVNGKSLGDIAASVQIIDYTLNGVD